MRAALQLVCLALFAVAVAETRDFINQATNVVTDAGELAYRGGNP